SGDQDTEKMRAVCPLRGNSSRPSAASHTFAVPSILAVANLLPSGDQDTEWTPLVCPMPLVCALRLSSSRPPVVSHTLAVPSQLPVASRLPSGDQDTAYIWARWPISVHSSRWQRRCQ